jgi:DNA-binding Xre family transcriptional regulator
MSAKKKFDLAEQLRAAIVRSGHTHYRLAKMAKISPAVIDRFVSGERKNLRLDTVSKLASALKLQLS